MVIVRKRVEKSICDSFDRISDLPDPILCKILSFLPTKNVVGTCILSKRWNNLDPFSYAPISLDIDDELYFRDIRHESSSKRTSVFVDFMNKLMNETLLGVPCLESMDLKCNDTWLKFIDVETSVSWVSAALRYNVRKLALDVPMHEALPLFESLNGCKTLVSLKFVFHCELDIPENFGLPCLKQLELVNYDGEDISEFIDGCPVLEKLEMDIFQLNFEEKIYIRCPLLKDLTIISEGLYNSHVTELDLHVPNLETLMLKNYIAIGACSTFSSLISAHICVDAMVDGPVTEMYTFIDFSKIIAACSNTKALYLSKKSLWYVHDKDLELPQYQNLTLLTLDCVRFVEEWEMLAHLLVNAPNLKELTFKEGFDRVEKGYTNFIHSLPSLPTCLELHLQKIEFRVSKYNLEQINLVEYFLTNGKVLEKLILRCCPSIDLFIVKRLLRLPNQSKICLEQI